MTQRLWIILVWTVVLVLQFLFCLVDERDLSSTGVLVITRTVETSDVNPTSAQDFVFSIGRRLSSCLLIPLLTKRLVTPEKGPEKSCLVLVVSSLSVGSFSLLPTTFESRVSSIKGKFVGKYAFCFTLGILRRLDEWNTLISFLFVTWMLSVNYLLGDLISSARTWTSPVPRYLSFNPSRTTVSWDFRGLGQTRVFDSSQPRPIINLPSFNPSLCTKARIDRFTRRGDPSSPHLRWYWGVGFYKGWDVMSSHVLPSPYYSSTLSCPRRVTKNMHLFLEKNLTLY